MIILALVVLVAVPALMFLGSGFHENIDQVSMEQYRVNSGGDNPAKDNSNNVDQGRSSNTDNTSWDDVNDERPVLEKDDLLVGNGWSAKYNEETGEMIFSVNESNDNGTNTASVQGDNLLTSAVNASPTMTKTVSRRIRNLSQMRDATGKPLPEDLQTMLVSLGNIGINMGNTEKFLAEEYTQDGVTLFNALVMDQKIRQLRAQHDRFSSAFSELHSLLASNPDYKNLMPRFLALAGMISYTADANFFEPAGHYIPTYADVAVVGRKPKRVPSILEATDVTTGSGQEIGGLAP